MEYFDTKIIGRRCLLKPLLSGQSGTKGSPQLRNVRNSEILNLFGDEPCIQLII